MSNHRQHYTPPPAQGPRPDVHIALLMFGAITTLAVGLGVAMVLHGGVPRDDAPPALTHPVALDAAAQARIDGFRAGVAAANAQSCGQQLTLADPIARQP